VDRGNGYYSCYFASGSIAFATNCYDIYGLYSWCIAIGFLRPVLQLKAAKRLDGQYLAECLPLPHCYFCGTCTICINHQAFFMVKK
jgi:hypothetical protein